MKLFSKITPAPMMKSQAITATTNESSFALFITPAPKTSHVRWLDSRGSDEHPGDEDENRPADIEEQSSHPGAQRHDVLSVFLKFVKKGNEAQADPQDRHHHGKSQKGQHSEDDGGDGRDHRPRPEARHEPFTVIESIPGS
jgi:hypothetical protein